MRLDLPQMQNKPQTAQGQWTLEWRTFFQRLWETLGWSTNVPVWDTLSVDPHAAKKTTSTASYGSFDLQSMPDTAINFLQAVIKLPNDFKPGTDLKPFMEWAPATGGTGNVFLRFTAWLVSSGEVIASSYDEPATAAVPGMQDQLTRTLFPSLSGAEKGDTLLLSVARTGTHVNDTYTGSIGIVTFGVQYQREGSGYEQEHP